MTITTTPTESGQLLLAVDGAMTIYEANANKDELLAALADSDGLEIDLSGVDEIDTAGLQLLVLVRREGIKAGKSVHLVSRSAEVVEVLDRYALRAYFDDGAPAARQ